MILLVHPIRLPQVPATAKWVLTLIGRGVLPRLFRSPGASVPGAGRSYPPEPWRCVLMSRNYARERHISRQAGAGRWTGSGPGYPIK